MTDKDIDRLIKASLKLEKRAKKIPAWMKGYIVFANGKT